MSNYEVFEIIFENVSKKIIDNYFKNINVIKNDKGKYFYKNNINLEELDAVLNNNINEISEILSTNLLITDKTSLNNILKNHYNSNSFKESLKKITYSFTYTKKIECKKLKKIYNAHLKKNLMNNQIIEKILAITPELNFFNWILRKWKIFIFGYTITLLVLIITYYVFLIKN